MDTRVRQRATFLPSSGLVAVTGNRWSGELSVQQLEQRRFGHPWEGISGVGCVQAKEVSQLEEGGEDSMSIVEQGLQAADRATTRSLGSKATWQ